MKQRSHYIHSNKYRLQVIFLTDETIQISWGKKVNNYHPKRLIAQIPPELMEQNKEEAYTKLWRYRQMHIKPSVPLLIYQRSSGIRKELVFDDKTQETNYNKREAIRTDDCINLGVKYWNFFRQAGQVTIVCDPYHKQIHICVLKRGTGLRVAHVIISLHSEASMVTVFKDIPQQLTLEWDSDDLILHHPLLHSAPLAKFLTIPSSEPEQPESEQQLRKKTLFKHIFLTELITHMIVNQLGRKRLKGRKEREGYEQVEYHDEQLEGLRSWGHRMYEFRDHPIKHKKKKKKENKEVDSLDEDEEEEEEKQKTVLGKMGNKIQKIIKKDNSRSNEFCNFTFMSGYQKSKINKMRYCLHQMSRETDHTQAMINFIQLAFSVYSKSKSKLVGISYLISSSKDIEQEEELHSKKGEMSKFMKIFKVKRNISQCLREYTRSNFFHVILNIGLRVLEPPYQLVYLRMGFSHIFWSIKFLYHRHKRAVFNKKGQKNKKRTIQIYRGCEVSEKELQDLKINRGGYMEVEGFLSTSLNRQSAETFAKNLMMVIKIPVINLKSMFDNGFAHIKSFSFYSQQNEVLINAFNVFKLLELKKAKEAQKYHELVLEYGSIKGVEEQVMKKSDDLIDYYHKWKVDRKKISEARLKLEVFEEKMTKKEHHKLIQMLPEEERKLESRKKKLDEWIEREQQQAVGKLTQWDKELILNTKHQQQQISLMEDYGVLLYSLGEYRKACVYLRRKIKQVELDRAVEGLHWRKSQCLIYKEDAQRQILYQSYSKIGRPAQSWEQMEKLLHLYASLNIPPSDQKYYILLYNMYNTCPDMVDKDKERTQKKKQLLEIMEQYKLKNKLPFQMMMQIEERQKEWEQLQQERKKKGMKKSKKQQKKELQEKKIRKAKRKKRLDSLKEQLKHIRLQTYGLFSYYYLQKLMQLIRMLYLWNNWKLVMRYGKSYLQIRELAPHVQNQQYTCFVLLFMLGGCIGGRKWELQTVCEKTAEFIHSNIHNCTEFNLIIFCIQCCLRLSCWIKFKLLYLQPYFFYQDAFLGTLSALIFELFPTLICSIFVQYFLHKR